MKRKIILITTDQDHSAAPEFRERFVIFKNYGHAIYRAGGLPVLAAHPMLADEYCELCDGLMISGGGGIHPARYGGTFHEERTIVGATRISRDEIEFGLFDAFKRAGKPILGICHGLAMINAALGGSSELGFTEKLGEEHQSGCNHAVVSEKGSLISRLFGDEFIVNSYHKNRVDRLGDGLKITARSPKGAVEAIEHETLPIFAVQWHPERTFAEWQEPNPLRGPDNSPLFDHFISLCG